MWSLFVFLVLVIFKAEASLPDNEAVVMEIRSTAEPENTRAMCDPNYKKREQNITYTVLEGEEMNIVADSDVQEIQCVYYNGRGVWMRVLILIQSSRNVSTFRVTGFMGGLWKCRNSLDDQFLHVDNLNLSACFMNLHVRKTGPPQTIHVNNVALQAVRTDLSEKDVDFTAEYEYVDGDTVKVTCVNFLQTGSLMMEYPMADTLSDKFNSTYLSAHQDIGFAAKLRSGHNNSYMICTHTGPTDYTKVMVRFVMQTEFNIVSIKINGMSLRPKAFKLLKNNYRIEYNYLSNQTIHVVCEVERADMVLVVTDSGKGFVSEVKDYNKTDIKPSKQVEMSFNLNGENKALFCASDYRKRGITESIKIFFSAGNFPIDEYPMHLELPSHGTVMELNIDIRKVIYYEFEAGEALWLKCEAPTWSGASFVYLQSGDSVTCGGQGCYISQLLELTREDTTFSCYLKAQNHDEHFSKQDKLLREIRVIFRWKGRIATTSTTTTTLAIPTNQTEVDLDHAPTHVYMIILSALGVIVLIAFLVVYLKAQKRCCYRPKSQAVPLPEPGPDPAPGYYENLLSVFIPINQREAEAMENHYEEIQ